MSSLFNDYQPESFFDEVFSKTGKARSHYGAMLDSAGSLSPSEYSARQKAVDAAFLRHSPGEVGQGLAGASSGLSVSNEVRRAERCIGHDFVLPKKKKRWKKLQK